MANYSAFPQRRANARLKPQTLVLLLCYNNGVSFPSLFEDPEDAPRPEETPEPEAAQDNFDVLADAPEAIAEQNFEEPEAAVIASPTPSPHHPITPSPGHPAPAIRLMHIADVHLGVETHGKANPETGLNTRLEDFTKALNDAVDIALADDVDICVFAGDAYKVRDPSQTHQRAFASGLRRLSEAGVPIVMLVGNHDIHNMRGRAHALEIYGVLGGAGVYILQSPEVIAVPTRRGDVLVAGMPYLTRSRVVAQDEAKGKSVEEVANIIRDQYAEFVADMARQVAAFPKHIAVLTGHFTVADARVGTQGALIAPAEPQVPVSALALPEFSYVAMGHIHKFQDLNKKSHPPVVYSGSIDRVDFGERDEVKGFVIAEIVKGEKTALRHVPLNTRPFVEIRVDTQDSDDPTSVILDAIKKRKVNDAIVRLIYRVPPERFALVRGDEIKKALSGAHTARAMREVPPAEATQLSQEFAQILTPEKALELYLENETRLTPRKAELMEAAVPLFEILAHEESAA